MSAFNELFNRLYNIDVSKFIEKKKNGQVELSYLSWPMAVKIFTENVDEWEYSDPTYEYDEDLGYMVTTSISVRLGDEVKERSMWLPVMDGANKAMKKQAYTYKTKFGEKVCEPASAMDLNKTYMRCLVKNMSMFGLGLYVYQGEDLPLIEEKVKTKKEYEPESDPGDLATPRQLETIKKLGTDVVANVVNHFGLDNIDEITKAQASEVIGRFLKKNNG